MSVVIITGHTMQIGKLRFEVSRHFVDSSYTREWIITQIAQAIKNFDGFGVIDILMSAQSHKKVVERIYSAASYINDRGLLGFSGLLNLCESGAKP